MLAVIYVYKAVSVFNNLYELGSWYQLTSLGINLLMDKLNFYQIVYNVLFFVQPLLFNKSVLNAYYVLDTECMVENQTDMHTLYLGLLIWGGWGEGKENILNR